MNDTSNHFAEAAMLIRKPVTEVYEAFINPEITTKFWFTKSSGRLELNSKVDWVWEMYNVTIPVTVKALIPNQSIVIQWSDDPDQMVEWVFEEIASEKTFVTVKNTGFKGSCEELISQIRESTGGFTWLLSGLKAYLEHGIELNLVADRFPQK